MHKHLEQTLLFQDVNFLHEVAGLPWNQLSSKLQDGEELISLKIPLVVLFSRVLKPRTSGSLTATTALSAYQQAAVATQKKTNAVTIFFKVSTTFLSILNVTVESGVIRVR